MKRTAFASIVTILIAGPMFGQTSFPHDVPDMIEEAEAAGIVHQYSGPWEYFVGGGAASLDCNSDRLPDVFLAGGKGPASLYVNQSIAGGRLSFLATPVIEDESGLNNVTGAYPINLNNDAHPDLVVLRVGENTILKGGPNCTFETANEAFGFEGGVAWTTAFSAIWEVGRDYPTLAFGNYVNREADGSPWGTCHNNRIVRAENGPTPVFSDETLLSPGYCALSMLFTDWNNSGEYALRITNDRQYHRGGQEQLWDMSDPAAPRAFSTQDGWRRLVIWGMGIAAQDINGDGRPEYALSSMGDTMLQTLDDEAEDDLPVYRDIAFDLGTTAHRPYKGDSTRPSTGWHTQFADVNNDTRIDLFIAKGNVEEMSDFAAYDPDNLLLQASSGIFSEQGDATGIALDRRGRGALVEDFNADGMLDLLVVNREAPASLFRNAGAKLDWGHRRMGNFLAIELRNGGVNRNAIGAVIKVKTGNVVQTRTIQIGGGHVSGQLGFMHFGLGVAERAEIRIRWPDGERSKPLRAFANNFVVIDRKDPDPRHWYPPKY